MEERWEMEMKPITTIASPTSQKRTEQVERFAWTVPSPSPS